MHSSISLFHCHGLQVLLRVVWQRRGNSKAFECTFTTTAALTMMAYGIFLYYILCLILVDPQWGKTKKTGGKGRREEEENEDARMSTKAEIVT